MRGMGRVLISQFPCLLSRICYLLSAMCYLLSSLLSTGCVYRSLTIRTQPPGAFVYVNNKLKGQSPVTYDFQWYGGYHVMIRKEGYEQLDDHQLLRAPVHFWIPFDLVMELLPLAVRDDRTWDYTLTLKVPADVPLPAWIQQDSKSQGQSELSFKHPTEPGSETDVPEPIPTDDSATASGETP